MTRAVRAADARFRCPRGQAPGGPVVISAFLLSSELADPWKRRYASLTPVSLQSGARLGPYEIVAPLGAGGKGEVYQARDPRLARAVAIKVLPEEFSSDAKLRLRFEREARAS